MLKNMLAANVIWAGGILFLIVFTQYSSYYIRAYPSTKILQTLIFNMPNKVCSIPKCYLGAGVDGMGVNN